MYRLCLLGCVVFLAACGEKAPDEGAIRVSVKYGTFKPACVRVEAKDANGHQEATDILSSQFKNAEKNEVLVAVRRKADWDQALTVTASSYASSTATGCDGPFVEQHSSNGPLTVVARKFTNFEVTLKATDADGDGHLAGAMWSEPSDCDDSNPARYPGAVETCGATVDLNCNQLVGCQEPNCGGNPCDDGNACTTGDHCEGSGLEAKCVPTQTTTCTQPTGVCDARLTCNPASGLCEAAESTVGKSCNDGNACTDGDSCGADGKCGGTARTCTTSEQCLSSSGTCNPANGQCVFTPLPDTTACQDPLACTTPDRCDGNGNCVGTPTTCAPAPCYRVKQLCTVNTECEYEVDLNGTCTTSGGVPGVCMADASCTPFPYRPSNFDPNAIVATDIGELRTNGSVTFDTTDSSWSPPGAITSEATLKIVSIPQPDGNPPALLIPVRVLDLKGDLTITGPSPVILAVYGDANVNQSILTTGNIPNGNTECGASNGVAGTYSGTTGGGGGGAGNGTSGASGGKTSNGSTQGAAGTSRPTTPEPLLGGCAGGNGGGHASAAGGKGGAGGGALQLSVSRTLTVSKNVSASGNGGEGGKASGSAGAGGGGGGSGGRVVLEAFQIQLTSAARITANGGGGGKGGSDANNAGAGGTNGSQTTATPAGGGNTGNTTGGAGGAGGAGMEVPTPGSDGVQDLIGTRGGGGGGGGAAGHIHLRSVQSCAIDIGAVVSPSSGCTAP
nr:putative metal-binding motif-containing protein [Corallococcus coralloides]